MHHSTFFSIKYSLLYYAKRKKIPQRIRKEMALFKKTGTAYFLSKGASSFL